MMQKKYLPLVKYLSIFLTCLLAACQYQPLAQDSSGAQRINWSGECHQVQEDQYRDDVLLTIEDGLVKNVDWVAAPKQGTCRFSLADFKQINQNRVVLESKSSPSCKLFVWQNSSYITLAQHGCSNICSAEEHVLPILLNPEPAGCYQK